MIKDIIQTFGTFLDIYKEDQDAVDIEQFCNLINDLNEEGQYEDARERIENALSEIEYASEWEYERCRLYYALGETYLTEYISDETKEELLKDKALDYFKRASEHASNDGWKSLCFLNMAECCGDFRKRRYLIAAMCCPDMRPDLIKEYNSITDFLLNFWLDPIDYRDEEETEEEYLENVKPFVSANKKHGISPYIFIAQDENHLNGCYDPTDTIFWVFTKNKVPKELTFPNGHPMANTLYIPHPLHPTQYLPMEQAEQMLFLDKLREFCYIVQCLGAKKIEFFTVSGQKLSTHATSNNSFDASGNFKMHEMSGNYSHGRSRDYSSIDGNEINMNQTFKPKSAPYCPDDVEWYHKEKGWKDLVRQRLNGDLTHYDFYISSQETTNINESEEKAISIAYNNILMNLKANYKNTQKTSIARSQHQTWRISVDFASKAEISSNATKYNSSSKQLTSEEKKLTSETQNDYGALTSEEQEYLTEYKECIVDGGVISDKERRLLSRLAKSLGISDARIQELEALASISEITEEEQEYLNEYKACLADNGNISEKEQRLLSRLAKSLGISDEKVKELQMM